jgi:restriction system protein
MPRRKHSWADDLVLAPWWVSLALAFIAYAVLKNIRPFAPLAPLVGFVLIAIAVISALRSLANRRMLDRQTGIDSLRALPWKQFEDLLGEAYRRQGYKVTEALGGGADGGVDLVLQRSGKVTLVQCKRWRGQPVPVQTVRELYGVMIDQRADAAKLVATTSFTSEAITFARGKPIELIDSDALLQLIRDVQKSAKIPPAITQNSATSEAPSCPQCGSEMVVREARRGARAGESFWGCSRYPVCRGIRNCCCCLKLRNWTPQRSSPKSRTI